MLRVLAVCAALLCSGASLAQIGDPAGFNEQRIERDASECTADPRCSARVARELRSAPKDESSLWDYLVLGAVLVFAWRFFFCKPK